jgi:hypothetical protein
MAVMKEFNETPEFVTGCRRQSGGDDDIPIHPG